MFWWSKGWCCDKLKDHFERRHERGFFVFAEPSSPDGPFPESFWLAMRSVRQEDVERLKQLNAPLDLPITIQTWCPIWYCPWCGVRLDRHYRGQLELLLDAALSAEHGAWA